MKIEATYIYVRSIMLAVVCSNTHYSEQIDAAGNLSRNSVTQQVTCKNYLMRYI
jgi:hypothetical protein